MICRKVTYKNFRNIEFAEIYPSENVTVLNGKNGQGKTNALEGIYLFAGMRSFRTVHESELVRFGCDSAEISLEYFDGKRNCTIIQRFVPSYSKRYINKNGVPITRMSEIMGSFRAVLFCPEHLSIVRDGPAERRRFLDSAISQTDQSYLRALQKYKSILMQRNALIASAREKHDDSVFTKTAELWSSQLSEQAEIISKKRADYTEKLEEKVSELLSDMTSGREKATFKYLYPRTADEYMKLLTENTDRELRAGITLYGSHKDDIQIFLNGKEARYFASQGQQRSIALAMKIAEGEISKDISGDYPVFLFDDILSELDSSRREYLLSGTSGRQTIITSCDSIICDSKVYKVSGGIITE